jgi:hypothetical protein
MTLQVTTTFWKDLTLRRGVLLAGHIVGIALVISWFVQPSAVDTILEAKPQRLPRAPLPSLPPRNAPPLDLIQSRALFHESRAFYVPPAVPAVPVEVKPPPPPYKVATVMMSAHHAAVALLTDAQGKGVLKVHQGDVLAGWTVESVEPKRVTLVFQQEHIELGPKLLMAAQSPAGNMGGTTATAGAPLATVNSAAPQGGIRILRGNASAAGVGRASSTPRVFQPPPH